jgi:hypothetical protein
MGSGIESRGLAQLNSSNIDFKAISQGGSTSYLRGSHETAGAFPSFVLIHSGPSCIADFHLLSSNNT